jgi:hypothetical protein
MNTGRFTQLLESKLGDVKPLLIQEMNFSISPYTLKPENGNILITNIKTNENKIYSLEVKQGFIWVDLKVLDFPNGNSIKVKAVGIEKIKPLNSNNLLNLIKLNWNKKDFDYITKEGDTIKFKQEI